jgi:flagellar assembly factor FliW
MKIKTYHSGTIDISEEAIITFARGIPAFPDDRRFIFFQPDPGVPFAFMQSLDHLDLAFIVADPFVLFDSYSVEIVPEWIEELAIKSQEDVMIWVILTVKGKLETATANLKAPVLLNIRSRLGKQVILPTDVYRTNHPIPVAGTLEKEKQAASSARPTDKSKSR